MRVLPCRSRWVRLAGVARASATSAFGLGALGLPLVGSLVLGCEERASAPPLMRVMQNRSEPKALEAPEAESTPEPPRVALDGTLSPRSVTLIEPGSKRIYSTALRTWIHEAPRRDAPRLGYLRAGSSTPTSGELAGNADCDEGWYPVRPRGFVCLSAGATFNADHPIVRATEAFAPDFSRKLPYIYGTVRKPGPIYGRLPSEEEMVASEPGILERMNEWLSAQGEIGASYAQHVWMGHGDYAPDPETAWRARQSGGVPGYLEGQKSIPNLLRTPRHEHQLVIDRMQPKVGYSFLETFFWRGRRYGVSTELKILPTDRLRPIQGSDFRGVLIGKEIDFPFAFVRAPRARFRDGKPAPYRSVLKLTGQQVFVKGVLHYETESGQWISDRDASRLDPVKKMPKWGKEGEKWIDVSLNKQTLMLYEGETPVYATLISSGEAGLEDHETSTATKRGIFRIHTKHITATMASSEVGEEFELQDVPYVQYFDKEGYALHGAYWHDRFGVPKSHGCLNLSPEDARRIFFWTEPRVPPGWHGALLPLRGTVMFIHP